MKPNNLFLNTVLLDKKSSWLTVYLLMFSLPVAAVANEETNQILTKGKNSIISQENQKKLPEVNLKNLNTNFTISPTSTQVISQDKNTQNVQILAPQSGITNSRTTSLVIKYGAGNSVKVFVNQKLLPSSTATDKQEDTNNGNITQTWYNIPLEVGENTISVQTDRGEAATVQLVVKEIKARINISPATQPRIRADGRSTVAIQGLITDDKGKLITQEVSVTLSTSAGKFIGADQDEDVPGFQIIAREGKFTAELQSNLQPQTVRVRAAIDRIDQLDKLYTNNDQIFLPIERGTTTVIGEKPTNNSNNNNLPKQNNVSLTTQYLNQAIEAYTQVEFIPNLRPSLVSGVVNLRIGRQGTDFYGSFRDFLRPDKMNDAEVKLNAQVFATGPIGEWLITGAYNSARSLNENCSGTAQLFKDAQTCDRRYFIYGDSSISNNLTPSRDSLYIKLERDAGKGKETDYFMWGDYNTTEFARDSQLFTATTRQLHGFKANYNLNNLQLTALYSPDVQGFVRDTIAPTGTSGYYFLSRRLLVPGSENVFIETEELNRPGTVLERKSLSRSTDYEIDYDRGTLLFRRPIFATEFDPFGTILVRRIVATYQFESTGGDTNLYAGRVQYNFKPQKISNIGQETQAWVAASYLRENQTDRNFELYGADLLLPFGKNNKLLAEIARSNNDSIFRGNITGNAIRAELQTNPIPGVLGKVYYRSVDENFTNNATFSFNPGQTRYGGEIRALIVRGTQLTASYDYEANYGFSTDISNKTFDLFNPQVEAQPGNKVDNDLSTFRVGVNQQLNFARLNKDVGTPIFGLEYINRQRNDRINSYRSNADQIVSRLNFPLTTTLNFRAQNEVNLNGKDPLYPSRTILGIDWAAYPGTNIRLAHQFYTGDRGGSSITSLETVTEKKLDENMQMTSRYSILGGANGMTGQGALGIKGGWLIAPGLRLNLGYEKIYSDLFAATGAGNRNAQPYTVGQSAAVLGVAGGDSYNVGVEYTDNPDFQASARLEHRTGGNIVGENTVISLGAAGKITPALTSLFRYQQASVANQSLQGLGNTMNLKLGLAYRDPNNDKFNGLFKYEYRQNPATIPETLLLGSGTGSTDHVFSLEGIYAPNWRWEFYGKYAFRISDTFLAQDFSNSTFTSLAQLRTTYRLGYRTDLAAEARWINQSRGFNEIDWALEFGYYLTPDLRLGVGYSFGSVRDRDFNGYRSGDGPYLGITVKVNELFGGFGRQKVTPRQQQESVPSKPIAKQE